MKKTPLKPCDTAKFRPRLPCLAPGDMVCYGEAVWGKKKLLDVAPKKIALMAECPYLEKVRAHWRRKGFGKD